MKKFFSEAEEPFDSIHDIIRAMDYLRKAADKTGHEDVKMVIDSAFRICFVLYWTLNRNGEFDKITDLDHHLQ